MKQLIGFDRLQELNPQGLEKLGELVGLKEEYRHDPAYFAPLTIGKMLELLLRLEVHPDSILLSPNLCDDLFTFLKEVLNG